MTTDDPTRQLGSAAGLTPHPNETPQLPTAAAGNTPGVALAGARVPGAPTVPDYDPMSLTRLVSSLANDLFAAPPAGPVPSHADANSVAMPAHGASPPAAAAPAGMPAGPSESTTAMAASPQADVPVANASPFMAPLDFSVLATPDTAFGGFDPMQNLSLSLIDPRVPSPALATEPGPIGAPTVGQAPPANAITFDTFEIAPTHDPSVRALGASAIDPNAIKLEFPILHKPVRGRRLVWLDNAATTQKPQAVIDRLSYFYENENSNIHRAAHTLAARATDAYESARETVRRFIKAPSTKEIIFVRGTTEGINLIAQSWGRQNIKAGDEILITWLEHHANIVPWQQLCSATGAVLKVAPVDDRGQVILSEYERLVGPKTKLVSFTQVSNALGTITPAQQMIDAAHRHGAVVVLDGAQAVSHMPVDVQALGCDFFVFSGHKVFGPTGIGAVFGKSELLESMPPWQGGGNMIQDVTFDHTTYQAAPFRFEAGTGNIADAVGLGAALDWVMRVGIERIEAYEHELLVYATQCLREVPGLTMIGTAAAKAGVLSFVLDGQKTEEVGGMLDQEGIAVRSGHHCAQPILRRFGKEATVRASLAPYNTPEDIDALVAALKRIQSGRTR